MNNLRRTSSVPNVLNDETTLREYKKFQKQTDKFNKHFEKFQSAAFFIDSMKNHPIIGGWPEIERILHECTERGKELLFVDFINARTSESMKILNLNLQKVLDLILPIKEFLEHLKDKAEGKNKQPERAKLEWYR